MKRLILLILLLLSVLIASGCSKSNIVDVANNDSEIKKGTEIFINNIHNKIMTVELKDSVDIGKIKTITFTTNDKELKSGSAILEKYDKDIYRFNGLNFMNYPNFPLAEPYYMTQNGKPYIVTIFRKYNIHPKKFKFKIGQDNEYSQEITINVPDKDYGIKVIELDRTYTGENIGTGGFVFYDENNTDITDKVKLSE